MAKVCITCVNPQDEDGYHRLLASASNDPFGTHTVIDNPEQADLILFVESWEADWKLSEVRQHSYLHTYPEKCFACCEQDVVIPYLPGVYASMNQFDHVLGRVRTGFYLWMYENRFIEYDPSWDDDMYLFSFMGSMDTAGIRTNIKQLEHTRALIRDTSEKSSTVWWNGSAEQKAQFRRQYAETCKRSKFILCPRGISPSTVRLFETMKTGRVPVILSDAWVPPKGPEWNTFSVQVAESDIHRIPALLESLESQAPEMGQKARTSWEEWFSPEVSFHRIVEWCLDIKQSRWIPEPFGRFAARFHLLQPKYARRFAGDLLDVLEGSTKQLAGS